MPDSAHSELLEREVATLWQVDGTRDHGAMAPEGERLTDRASLADEYRDDTSLRSRQSIYEFVEVAPPLAEVFERLPIPADGTLVDIGCGNGLWAAGLRMAHPEALVVGLDRHRGMLEAMGALEAPSGRVEADAHTLPLGDDSVDVAMALWMLYHLADLPTALREIRRVVRRGGVVLAITNQRTHLAELHEILDAALAPHLDGRPATGGLAESFDGANGEGALTPVFGDIEVVPLDGQLAVTEPAAVVAYVASLRLALDARLGAAIDWPRVMAVVEERAQQQIADAGSLRVTTASVAYLATVSG